MGIGSSLGVGEQPTVAPTQPELETEACGAERQRGRQPIGDGPVLPQPPEAERQEGGQRDGPQQEGGQAQAVASAEHGASIQVRNYAVKGAAACSTANRCRS